MAKFLDQEGLITYNDKIQSEFTNIQNQINNNNVYSTVSYTLKCEDYNEADEYYPESFEFTSKTNWDNYFFSEDLITKIEFKSSFSNKTYTLNKSEDEISEETVWESDSGNIYLSFINRVYATKYILDEIRLYIENEGDVEEFTYVNDYNNNGGENEAFSAGEVTITFGGTMLENMNAYCSIIKDDIDVNNQCQLYPKVYSLTGYCSRDTSMTDFQQGIGINNSSNDNLYKDLYRKLVLPKYDYLVTFTCTLNNKVYSSSRVDRIVGNNYNESIFHFYDDDNNEILQCDIDVIARTDASICLYWGKNFEFYQDIIDGTIDKYSVGTVTVYYLKPVSEQISEYCTSITTDEIDTIFTDNSNV